MDHTPLVGLMDLVANQLKEAEAKLNLVVIARDAARAQEFAQVAPAQELHRKKVFAGIGAACVVNGADVGVLQARERLDFALEHAHGLFVDERTAAHHLERYTTARVLLLGLEHRAHAALAELTDDDVRADCVRNGCVTRKGSAAEGVPAV